MGLRLQRMTKSRRLKYPHFLIVVTLGLCAASRPNNQQEIQSDQVTSAGGRSSSDDGRHPGYKWSADGRSNSYLERQHGYRWSSAAGRSDSQNARHLRSAWSVVSRSNSPQERKLGSELRTLDASRDLNGSLTHGRERLRKSVDVNAPREIDTASSAITQADVKGARGGEGRTTNWLARAGNQVSSPALVESQLRPLSSEDDNGGSDDADDDVSQKSLPVASSSERSPRGETVKERNKLWIPASVHLTRGHSRKLEHKILYDAVRKTEIVSEDFLKLRPNVDKANDMYRYRATWNRYITDKTSALPVESITQNSPTPTTRDASSVSPTKESPTPTPRNTPISPSKESQIRAKRDAPIQTPKEQPSPPNTPNRAPRGTPIQTPKEDSSLSNTPNRAPRGSPIQTPKEETSLPKTPNRAPRGTPIQTPKEEPSPPNRAPKGTPPSSDPSVSQNSRARKEGDIIIGALFPLHYPPDLKTAYSRQCSKIREYYGIQRVEVFLMTIERINRDPDLLPNITLGWDIRDTCWYSPIALENSIDFIKDAIASQQQAHSSAASSATPSSPSSTLPPPPSSSSPVAATNSTLPTTTSLLSPLLLSSSTSSTSSPVAPGHPASSLSSTAAASPSSSTSSSSSPQSCGASSTLKPIVGLVGPGSSETSIQVQNLLQIFNIPQIGYSATSYDLSDKSHYKYFLRVVPPDLYQAQALADIVSSFNWTYISLVHSDGNYGTRGMEAFKDRASEKGICFGAEDNIASSAEDDAFDAVVDKLIKWPNATVVVCFCEGITVHKLMKATLRKKVDGEFLLIGSDGWGNRLDVVKGVESASAGAISLMLYSPPVPDFAPHYAALGPHGSPNNPWFQEFWEEKFQCSLNTGSPRRLPPCSGNESLAGADEDSKLGFVVTAVEAMAHGLHNMHRDLCPEGGQGLCEAMTPINGSLYLKYLLNVRFKRSETEEVYFDSKGDPPGRYEILNYQPTTQPNGNTTYKYVTIGHWINGSLLMNGHNIFWPKRSHGYSHKTRTFRSICSEPCKFGQATKVRGQTCCWICATCLENQILVDNNTECKPCDLGMWPNANKTDCLEIPIDFIDIGDTEAIVCVSLACLGIFATAWIAAIFVRNHDTPIVKASTRELSYILLIGIALAFGSNFFIVAKPRKEFCYIVRILPGLSFSLIYGALVTRTNRIARILEGSKRILTKKPKFMSASAQLVITGIIIGVECAVIVGMLVYQPANSKLDYPAPQEVRLVCDTSTLGIVVPLGFDLVLILLCTIYAVKTRNLPENFNEAKFIGFTMYATCVIWMGFFPIYFAGEHKEVTLCICVSLSAAIALLLLFVPKVYIIVWVPEKNTRGAFTTSRDVRCHIGSKSMASVDSVDLRESSTLDSLFKSEKGLGKVWRQKSLDERRLRFVMQRTNTGSDSDTPYSNHGVLSASTAALLPQQSRDKAGTEPTPKHASGHRKSLDSRVTYLELPRDTREAHSKVEALRQNLARDFPEHQRRPHAGHVNVPPMRPGSPAEREKHRVQQASLEHLVDLDSILLKASSSSSTTKGGGGGSGSDAAGHRRSLGRLGEFRKSLSSSCVSSSAGKTRNAECQTSDELVQALLAPALRRRCGVAKGKKLERSLAVVDDGGGGGGGGSSHHHHHHACGGSGGGGSGGGSKQTTSSSSSSAGAALKAVHVFNYPPVYHQKHAVTIQKQPLMFLTLADDPKAASDSSRQGTARPKRSDGQAQADYDAHVEDSNSSASFIPTIRHRCCQQICHHPTTHIPSSHRCRRKYQSMVVAPSSSHVSADHVCDLQHAKTYRFPRLYGFGQLTPSCSSDTSCVDDSELVPESLAMAAATATGKRPKSASPGHSGIRGDGGCEEEEYVPFLSPARLPRDARSHSAGYIPLHTDCGGGGGSSGGGGRGGRLGSTGVCWVESLAASYSANDGSNASTTSTTDSSSLVIPRFQSSVDSDGSQISNDEDEDEDGRDGDDDDCDDDEEEEEDEDLDRCDLPEGLELYISDPRTGSGLAGRIFTLPPHTTTSNGTSAIGSQALPRSQERNNQTELGGSLLFKEDGTPEDTPQLLLPSFVGTEDFGNQRTDENIYENVDNSSFIQTDPCSRPLTVTTGNGQVAGGLQGAGPENLDMMEFQQYLQGHGVNLDLSSVQSSDL